MKTVTRYEFTLCGRCRAMLEPAPFGTPENDEDWGHPTMLGQQCWPDDGTAETPLFPVMKVALVQHADGHWVFVCPTCDGEGEVKFNRSPAGDPQMEESGTCSTCGGSGEPTSEENT